MLGDQEQVGEVHLPVQVHVPRHRGFGDRRPRQEARHHAVGPVAVPDARVRAAVQGAALQVLADRIGRVLTRVIGDAHARGVQVHLAGVDGEGGERGGPAAAEADGTAGNGQGDAGELTPAAQRESAAALLAERAGAGNGAGVGAEVGTERAGAEDDRPRSALEAVDRFDGLAVVVQVQRRGAGGVVEGNGRRSSDLPRSRQFHGGRAVDQQRPRHRDGGCFIQDECPADHLGRAGVRVGG